MTALIVIIAIICVFCLIPLFAFIVFGIKAVIEKWEAKQKHREQQEEARKQEEQEKAAREAEERKCAALAEKYGVPAVRPAAAPLLEKPADERRAELASFVGQVRQLPPDLLAEAESWEAAPAVEIKKEGSAIFSSSLLRNGDELVLIQKPHIWGDQRDTSALYGRRSIFQHIGTDHLDADADLFRRPHEDARQTGHDDKRGAFRQRVRDCEGSAESQLRHPHRNDGQNGHEENGDALFPSRLRPAAPAILRR